MLLVQLLAVLSSLQFSATASVSKPPKLLLVSFDGFRWNYLSRLPKSKLPNFDAFIKQGVQARWVENVFPTVTLPNHMSMVSGLYVESHGIVHNHIFDPILNATMPKHLHEDDSKWVDLGAEPIWVTNSKAGEGRRSGSFHWPTSTAKMKGYVPEIIQPGPWDDEDALNQIDAVFEWFVRDSEPANFVAFYTGNPDHSSHEFGPDSQQVLDIIVHHDRLVGRIMELIKKHRLEGSLNVIITADHGHAPVSNRTMINIDLLIDSAWYTTHQSLKGTGVMAMLTPKPGYFDKVVDGLKHPNLHVAIKGKSQDLKDLHYSDSYRIAPIVIYGEPGWCIGQNGSSVKEGEGEHGWDPRYFPQMYPFFIAKGPAFKEGLRNAAPFHIVDIYPLMCHLLGLTPAPNNGSLSNTAHLLLAPPSSAPVSRHYNVITMGIGAIILVLAVVVIVCVVRRLHKKKHVTATYKRAFTEESVGMSDGVVAFQDEDDDS